RAQVQPVVVEAAAREAEEADGELEAGEGEQRRAARQAFTEDAAGVAAQAEADHEGGHDHGDGVDADTALKGEEPLPGDLVDERGGAAQEEGESDGGDSRGRGR